jgi:hypothetical protein
MNAIEREPGAPGVGRQDSRLMLVLADGCRVCVGLDAIEGVFEIAGSGTELALPPDGDRIPVVSWAEASGAPGPADTAAPSQVVVVRTQGGRVGLAAQACLGLRDAAFGRAAVLPTRLADGAGEVLCFVHMIDRRPHFILDPRALALAVRARSRAAGNGAYGNGAYGDGDRAHGAEGADGGADGHA